MKFISTRGKTEPVSFNQAVMMGLASDGGLLLPETIPTLSESEIEELATRPYTEMAFTIFTKFIGSDIPETELRKLINKSYKTFATDLVAPLHEVDGLYIQELFHGPTLAFKDVALQFLGNLFEYLLQQQNRSLNIIGATSGDTGSAAIHGLRGKENINIFILHPYGKVSQIQEKQMTSVLDDNVFNLAIDGNFDDGQRVVKEIFADLDFKQRYNLGAVNSINWARIMAQIVYYFSAYSQLSQEQRKDFSVVVPTGNFGNIMAGWIAKKMGLPIKKLILATNANDILSRFINTGIYESSPTQPTLSPSMDIQLASNFERYLYYLTGCNPQKLKSLLAIFNKSGKLALDSEVFVKVKDDFAATRVDDQATLETIKNIWEKSGYILDPHTATGVYAANKLREISGNNNTIVCLATAHPAKFPKAVKQAIGKLPPTPPAIAALENLPCRSERIKADTNTVKVYIENKL